MDRSGTFLQDLSRALRSLRRTPAFTVTALLTLALGIGVNIPVFSVVNGVLLRPLPFHDADRIIQLTNGDGPATLSEPEVVDLRRDARSFSTIGTYSFADGNITSDGLDPERIRIARVDAGFFATLQPMFLLGRGFLPEEDAAGAADVVVISHGLWQRRFFEDPAVLGGTIVVNGVPRTILGVTPPEFDFPSADIAVWTPLRLDRAAMVTRNNHYLATIARLGPDVTIASADDEMRALRDRWLADYPESYNPDSPFVMDVRPVRERIVGRTQPYLVALFGAVGFVLLIACVNVANLLILRGEQRRHEMAVRAALGAGGGQLVKQPALEGAALAVAGTFVGLAAAWPTLRILLALAPEALPRTEEIALDGTALGFALGVCALVCLAFSIVPLTQTVRSRALESLNSSRGTGHVGGRASRRVRSSLVVAETALAVVTLSGAAVFLRTLSELRSTDLGFATEDILTARITLPNSAYDGVRSADFTARLVERVRAMPEVETAAAMAWTPIILRGGSWSVVTEEAPTTLVSEAPAAAPQQVTPGFFEVLGIPILRGRGFTDADRADAPPVVVVNETLARELWGTTDVLGRRLRMPAEEWPYMTVVGVVGDTRVDGIAEPPPGIMYYPHRQAGTTAYFTSQNMTLVVGLRPGAAPPIAAIRQALAELDRNLPLADVRMMSDVVASTIATQRFTTTVLGGLAALALGLAAIGIYGIIAYGVAQRRWEFGLRIALGAASARVVAFVLREGLALALVGLAIGIAGSLAVGRVLRSLLADTAEVDPSTIAWVSVVLLAAAALAGVVPARRAMAVNPAETLRAE